MAIMTYTLAEFIEDLRTITAEENDDNMILLRVSPLAERLALSREWLRPKHYECDEEQGFMAHLLHEEEDHTLAVFAISWLPGRGAPPHNHGTWAVVSGVDGQEKNIFYKRLDDASRPGYAEVVWNGERSFGAGEVVSFMPHELHSVVNETDDVTVSLHIYGQHLNYTGRSQFDIDNNAENPFILK
jgi:predicted metal-dependent enzyme (double-stranded beta helix superfamily)